MELGYRESAATVLHVASLVVSNNQQKPLVAAALPRGFGRRRSRRTPFDQNPSNEAKKIESYSYAPMSTFTLDPVILG